MTQSSQPTLYNATDLEVGKADTTEPPAPYLPPPSQVQHVTRSAPPPSSLTYNPSAKFNTNERVSYKPEYAVSYVNPKLEARTGSVGCGIFCVEPVLRDETLIVWTGRIVSAEDALYIMDTDDKHYILQIGDGFYQLPLSNEREPADWSNHSCAPTAGFGKNSPICLSAMRDLQPGDEVVFDYGMCETDERLWEPMPCECGAATCRGFITANDYKRRELWDRYAGYWSPHVQRLIDRLRMEDMRTAQQSQHQTIKLNNVQATIDTDSLSTSSDSDETASGLTAVTVSQQSDSQVYQQKQQRVFGWFDKLLMRLGLVRMQNLHMLHVIDNTDTSNQYNKQVAA